MVRLEWASTRYPRVYRRRQRRVAVVCTVAMVAVWMVNLRWMSPIRGALGLSGPLVTLVAPLFAIVVAAWVWRFVSVASIKRRARAAGFALCTECGYDLSRLEGASREVRCPECGTLVVRGAAQSAWRSLCEG